jgi:hypothetical protein
MQRDKKAGGAIIEQASAVQKERDTLILSTDATPSPGFSRVSGWSLATS